MTTPTRHVYVDTETTGRRALMGHQVWELAYAVGSGPVLSCFLPHSLERAETEALEINGYHDRYQPAPVEAARAFEGEARDAMRGQTIVAANAHFDALFLERRWSLAPWHYRLLDVEAYAAGVLGLPTNPVPGLRAVRAALVDLGYAIPEPDHTGGADVLTARGVHLAAADVAARRATAAREETRRRVA